VGLTGTIDNDITATDYPVGFDTAMNSVLNAVDQLRDTAESHQMCMIVEVMGRDCGEIALMTGIASGAAAVVIPEVPFDEAYAVKHLQELRASGKRNLLVIVSEGVKAEDGTMYGEHLLGVLKANGVDARFVRLGHIVRGGNPTLRDRLTASRMGAMGVDLLVEGKSDLVVVELEGRLQPIEINYALVLDRMYKGKLKDGDLDAFTPEQVEKMKATCAAKKAEIEKLYRLSQDLSK
jgi:6-phosphofructokinase 1